MFNWVISRLFGWANEIFIFFLSLSFLLLFFQVIYKVFSLSGFIILALFKNWFFSEIDGWKWLILKSLIDFFAHKFEDLRFVILLIEKESTLSEIMQNIAVVWLFILIFDVREYLGTFLSGDGNIFFFFEDAFDFFVLKLFFSISVTFHNSWDSFDMKFRIVFMELVILNDGFVFIVILWQGVHSTHEFLLFIWDCHFSENDCLFTIFVVNYVIHVLQIIYVLSIEVLMIQRIVYKNLKWGLNT